MENIQTDTTFTTPVITPEVPFSPVVSVPVVPAGRWNRWLASFVDDFLIGLFSCIPVLLFQISTGSGISLDEKALDAAFENVLVSLCVIAIYFSYRIGFLLYMGATPGKAGRHLRVVKYGTNQHVTLSNVLARELFKLVYLIPFLGGILYIISACQVLFTVERRTLHDRVGGTQVISTDSSQDQAFSQQVTFMKKIIIVSLVITVIIIGIAAFYLV